MIHPPPPPSALCYEILNRKEAEFYVEYAEWDLTLRTMENMRNCTASKKLWQWPHNKQILLLSLPSMFNLLSQMSPSPSSKSESKVQFQFYLLLDDHRVCHEDMFLCSALMMNWSDLLLLPPLHHWSPGVSDQGSITLSTLSPVSPVSPPPPYTANCGQNLELRHQTTHIDKPTRIVATFSSSSWWHVSASMSHLVVTGHGQYFHEKLRF